MCQQKPATSRKIQDSQVAEAEKQKRKPSLLHRCPDSSNDSESDRFCTKVA